MIKLTRKHNGTVMLINVRNIEYIYEDHTNTIVNMVSGQEIYVVESLQFIADLIEDIY